MEIAKTILHQLGGNKFIVMTGANNFIATENGLRMNIRRNKSGAKWLSITLNGNDLYDLEFSGIKKKDYHVFKSYNDVYNDQLCQIFEAVTGYYTRLF